MTDLRTAAQQALVAMDKATRYMSFSDHRKLNEAITALKAALEQPEKESVAVCEYCEKERPVIHAPRREWRGLSEEEMKSTCADAWSYDPYVIARAIEAKLKELNHE